MATTRTKKHDELRGKIAQARELEREISQTPGRLRAEYEVLAGQLMEHDLPIDGTPPPGGEARKLWDQRVAVKARLDGPWDARFQKAGPRRRSGRPSLRNSSGRTSVILSRRSSPRRNGCETPWSRRPPTSTRRSRTGTPSRAGSRACSGRCRG